MSEIHVFTPSELNGAGDDMLSLGVRKPYSKSTFYRVNFKAPVGGKPLSSSFHFALANFTLYQGVAVPGDAKDKRNEYVAQNPKSRLTCRVDLSRTGCTDVFLKMNKIYQEDFVPAIKKQESKGYQHSRVHDFLITEYSENCQDESKKGKPRESPLLQFKVDFDKKDPSDRSIKTVICDAKKVITRRDGKKDYDTLTLENGEPVTDANCHQVLRFGVRVLYARFSANTISINGSWVSWLVQATKLVVDTSKQVVYDDTILYEQLEKTYITAPVNIFEKEEKGKEKEESGSSVSLEEVFNAIQ